MAENKESSFYKDFENLLNRHGKDNETHTPDYLLTDYLIGCLDNYKITIDKNITWHSDWENKDIVEKYKNALKWCSASKDFGENGIAREGWLKICESLL